MSLLSDITIRGLCQLPETIFDEEKYQSSLNRQAAWPSDISKRDLIRNMLRTAATRPLNQVEKDAFVPMIAPFSPTLIREVEEELKEFPHGSPLCPQLVKRKIISKGTTSYGYDVSLSDDVRVFTNVNGTEIDPKRFDADKCLVKADIRYDWDGGRYVLLPPHSYMLASTVEYFRMPRDVLIVCVGKSTYARCGAIVNTTPIEPGFEGNVVIEIANTAPLPCRIYLGEGIAQFLFLRGDQPCEVSYGDRGGKYQGQTGVTMAKV